MAFKKYVRQVTEPDIDRALSRVSRNFLAALKEGVEFDKQYDDAKDGRTDVDFGTDLGVSSGKVTDWNQITNTFLNIDKAVEGDTTVTIPGGSAPWGTRLRKIA